MDNKDVLVMIGLSALVLVVVAAVVSYNVYDSSVKAELYRECLKTNEQLAAKAVEKDQSVRTISCYLR